MTNLIHTTRPTSQQKSDMLSLLSACKAKEPLSLSAPVEDDLEYDIFLLYENSSSDKEQFTKSSLAAMSFLFFSQETICECCVFVAPKKRRKGYFTTLLNKSLNLVEAYEKQIGQPVDFCFLVDEKTPSALAALEAIGAEYWYSEYKMERQLTDKDRNNTMTSLTIQDAGDNLYCAMLEGKVIGTSAILPSEQEIYLYAFQIHEDFQGQGYGKEFLLGMLAILSDMGSMVTVQVSGQNYIAKNLYKKTGFQTTESLSYYLY